LIMPWTWMLRRNTKHIIWYGSIVMFRVGRCSRHVVQSSQLETTLMNTKLQ
jgi:hypothetical protein